MQHDHSHCILRSRGVRNGTTIFAVPSSSYQSKGYTAKKKRRGPRSPKEEEEGRIKPWIKQQGGTMREQGDLRKERDLLIMQDPTMGEKWHLCQLLTTWIMKTRSLGELADLLKTEPNPERANQLNLIAALTQVSWLYKGHRLTIPPPNQLQGDLPHGRTVLDDFSLRQRAFSLAGTLSDRLMTRWRQSQGRSSDSEFDEVKAQGWIQVASAFARLGYNDPDRVGAFLPQLLGSLPHFSQPRHYAEACWSIAKLGRDPGPSWIEAMLESSRVILHHFNLAELSNVIWALAKWGYRPPPVYMHLFYRRCTYLLNALYDIDADRRGREPLKSGSGLRPSEESEQDDFSGTIVGGRAWIQTLKHVDPAGGNKVGSLSSLVWSLAMLKADAPMELSRALLIETQVQIPNMEEQALANIAWGLCKMNIRPPPSWVQDFEKQCRRKMVTFKRGIAFSNIIWSLSHWRAEPGEAWLREFVKRATPTVPSLDEDGIAALLQGLADLEHKPPNPWVSMSLEVFHKQGGGRSGVKPDALVAVLWSISRLLQQKRIKMDENILLIPGATEEVSDKMLAGSYAGIEDETTQDSERAVSIVSIFASGPGKQWVRFYLPILQDLADGVVVGMRQLDAPRLVDVLVAYADLGVHPGDPFIMAHQRQCDSVISSFTAYQVRLMSNAMSKLKRLDDETRVRRSAAKKSAFFTS